MRMMRAGWVWHVAAEVISRGERTGRVHSVYNVAACSGKSLVSSYSRPAVNDFNAEERESIGSHSDSRVCAICAARFLEGENLFTTKGRN